MYSAPSLSAIDAAQTTTKRMRPSVSVMRWRLRPFTCLAGLNPFSPPISVVATLWLSIMATLGSLSRPAFLPIAFRTNVLVHFHILHLTAFVYFDIIIG